jgi:hypothetical protein
MMGQLSVQEQTTLKEVGLWEVGLETLHARVSLVSPGGDSANGLWTPNYAEITHQPPGPIFIRCGAGGNGRGRLVTLTDLTDLDTTASRIC